MDRIFVREEDLPEEGGVVFWMPQALVVDTATKLPDAVLLETSVIHNWDKTQ